MEIKEMTIQTRGIPKKLHPGDMLILYKDNLWYHYGQISLPEQERFYIDMIGEKFHKEIMNDLGK